MSQKSSFQPGDRAIFGAHVVTIDERTSPFPGELLIEYDEYKIFDDGMFKFSSALASELIPIWKRGKE